AILGILRIHILRATNLPDTDRVFGGDLDPNTRVIAMQGAGGNQPLNKGVTTATDSCVDRAGCSGHVAMKTLYP
ncbi:hypothetical protein AB9K17_23645, partial [Salmonella enterica subsp. enterica serovar Kentucky]|uniref:hypothetical protein n=1 Tax=Salmonella enterica TaxID=28901 RepID=UPI003F4BA0E0